MAREDTIGSLFTWLLNIARGEQSDIEYSLGQSKGCYYFIKAALCMSVQLLLGLILLLLANILHFLSTK